MDSAVPLLRGIHYGEPVNLTETVTFYEPDDILGSTSRHLTIKDHDGIRRLLQSGDLG